MPCSQWLGLLVYRREWKAEGSMEGHGFLDLVRRVQPHSLVGKACARSENGRPADCWMWAC